MWTRATIYEDGYGGPHVELMPYEDKLVVSAFHSDGGYESVELDRVGVHSLVCSLVYWLSHD